MKKAGQIALVLTCFCWAQSMFVLGLSQLVSQMPEMPADMQLTMGLAFVAAGLFLAMWLVIDPLVPQAGRIFTGTLKLAMVVLFYICSAATLAGAWPFRLV